MKKVYAFILMLMMLGSIVSLTVKADVETFYMFDIITGHKYNLETGLYEADQGFAVSSKFQLRSTNLRLSSDTFTYLYVYNSNNDYLGFYGTQYSVDAVEMLPTFIDTIGTGVVYLPAAASKVAIAVQVANYNKKVDDTLSTLNNRSLRDVFEDHNLITGVYSVEDLDDVIAADWFSIDYENYINVQVLDDGYYTWGINLSTTIDIWTRDYYFMLSYQIINPIYYYNDIYITDLSTNTSLLTTIGDVGNVYTNYDTITTMPFDVSDYYIRFRIAVEAPLSLNILRYGTVAIDLDFLGLTALDEEDITDYLNLFLDGRLYDPEDVLSTASFDLIQPYYLGEDIPEDENLSPEALLDRLLDKVNMNNDTAKTIISVVVIIIAVVLMALRKLPSIVIVGLGMLLYVFFTYLGWVVSWINIVFGLVIVILLIMRFRGGKSNND